MDDYTRGDLPTWVWLAFMVMMAPFLVLLTCVMVGMVFAPWYIVYEIFIAL